MDDIKRTQKAISPPASGRFLLRIRPALHARLRQEARDNRLSLNELCARRLDASPGSPPAPSPLSDAVLCARAVLGQALVGVVAFGSWARGETADGSDVDLLVVVSPEIVLASALYREWDQAPRSTAGFPVEPHFVHLPARADPVSSLWAEVAIDGIVAFELGLQVSLLLGDIRRQIVAGRLMRRVAHGQPYWVRNEAA